MKEQPRSGVLLCGAYGLDNAGDDAVLRAISASLREYDSSLSISALARHAKKTARRFSLPCLSPWQPLRLWLHLRRTKLFICGGGSLLQNVTSRRSLYYYLWVLRLAKKAGCAVMLYGAGMGPLRGERDRAATAEVLNTCVDAITVRDTDSLSFLQQLGVTAPPARLAADPALRPANSPRSREKTIAFCLRSWPGFEKKAACFAAAARYARERYRLQPEFVLLGEGDRAAARAVCDKLDFPCRTVWGEVPVRRAELVISMRLHGAIFAFGEGIPCAGIAYDPKVNSFCREAGLPCEALSNVTETSLRRLLDEAATLDTEQLSESLIRLRQRERANLAVALALLEG